MISRGKAEKKATRTERLSAALRKNLKRRKAQVKAKAEGRVEAAPHDSAGIADDKSGR